MKGFNIFGARVHGVGLTFRGLRVEGVGLRVAHPREPNRLAAVTRGLRGVSGVERSRNVRDLRETLNP